MNAAELWWEQVPAGMSQLGQIARDLRNGNSIVLDAGRMVWTDVLRGYLRSVVTDINNAMPFERIDASGCPPEMSPDAFLFNCIGETDHYGTQLLRISRMRRKPVCLWVDGIPPQQYEAWVMMAVELMREPSQMMLILDVPEYVPVPECEGLSAMGVGHGRFDLYYFSLMQLSGMDMDERLLEYTATLCTELAGMAPVLCSQLCSVAEQLLRNPLHVANSLNTPDSRQCMRRAQVRAFMPLVELCRMMATDILAPQLKKQLPFRAERDTIREVGAFELGHIVYLADTNRLGMPDDLYETIRSLKEVRNQLAHLNLLSYKDILSFLAAMDALITWHNSALQEA